MSKENPINVLEISKFLKISIDEFLEKYTEEVEGENPEIVIKWQFISKKKQDEIKRVLFRKYDMKKNYKKQVLGNIKIAREIIYR